MLRASIGKEGVDKADEEAVARPRILPLEPLNPTGSSGQFAGLYEPAKDDESVLAGVTRRVVWIHTIGTVGTIGR